MSENAMKKPFFPRDKPKSFVLAILFVLIGLVCGLLAFAGAALNVAFLRSLGTTLFLGCWLVAFPSLVLFNIKNFAGRYRGLDEKDWKDQEW